MCLCKIKYIENLKPL